VKKKHCCQQRAVFITNTPSECAQMHRTTRPFAQRNLISRNFQHSKALEKHETMQELFELNGALFVFS